MNKSQVGEVESRQDLVSFVRLLANDCKQNPNAWENRDLYSYLESLAAWVEDMDGFYMNQGKIVPAEPSWKVIAQMLLAAKVYE